MESQELSREDQKGSWETFCPLNLCSETCLDCDCCFGFWPTFAAEENRYSQQACRTVDFVQYHLQTSLGIGDVYAS